MSDGREQTTQINPPSACVRPKSLVQKRSLSTHWGQLTSSMHTPGGVPCPALREQPDQWWRKEGQQVTTVKKELAWDPRAQGTRVQAALDHIVTLTVWMFGLEVDAGRLGEKGG